MTAKKLLELTERKYGSQKNYAYFAHELKKAYAFCQDSGHVDFYPLPIMAGDHMSAHIALICDDRLPNGEAFFGFFECPDDAGVWGVLWESLVAEARTRGISKLLGPINGSIWHQYRCTKESDGSNPFKSEPVCESYYHRLLSSADPSAEVLYYSAYREPFSQVLSMVGGGMEKLAEAGFSIRTGGSDPSDMRAVAEISRELFSGSWGYTELTEREFSRLYTKDSLAAHLSALYLLCRGDDIVGFCSAAREDEHTLILKTIGILPKYQGLGLGNALAYQAHAGAQAQGFTRVIYALIREGNSIGNFPKDDTVIFRRYAAFEFTL